MGFDVFYWTITGFLICFPVLILSVAYIKRQHYIPKFILSIAVFFAFCFFEAVFYEYIAEFEVIYVLSIILHHILSMLVLFFCNEMNLKEAIYCKIWATAAYYLAQQTASLFASIFGANEFMYTLFYMKIIMSVLFAGLLVFLAKKVIFRNIHIIPNEYIAISLLITVVGITFNAICFAFFNSKDVVIYLFQLFSMGVVTLSLFLLLETFQKHTLANEIEIRARLFDEHKKQFEMRREYIDVINKKFHDMKHQLVAIKYMVKDENVKKELNDMWDSISQYGYFVRTENPVIDTILTEKAEQFSGKNIQMNCMIDENMDISFIKVMDLYVVLGNAMDNVFECMTGSNQPEHGYVNIRMFIDKHFFRMSIKNNYSGCIFFENGLPKSNKDDSIFHGYGIKSIRDIVRKYNGEISVSADNGEFTLNIFIPIPIKH